MAMPEDSDSAALSPISGLDWKASGEPEEGVAICLSGGGFRAMLSHVGAIWRLNELGYLWKAQKDLKRLRRLGDRRTTGAPMEPAGLRWVEQDFEFRRRFAALPP